MKPHNPSFDYVNGQIMKDIKNDTINEIYFFDDMIDNLRTAKEKDGQQYGLIMRYQ